MSRHAGLIKHGDQYEVAAGPAPRVDGANAVRHAGASYGEGSIGLRSWRQSSTRTCPSFRPGASPFTRLADRCRRPPGEHRLMRSRMALLLASAALILGLTGCSGDGRDVSVEVAVLAVTVDAAGDEQQRRAMDIADRYAPQGSFSLEQETESEASTSGTAASRSSTVVVFEVEGDIDGVLQRLRDEPHVLEVALR